MKNITTNLSGVSNHTESGSNVQFQNPAHLCTSTVPASAAINFEDYDVHVVELLQEVYTAMSKKDSVYSVLTRLKNMFMLDIPLHSRPVIFARMNDLVKALMQEYPKASDVYQSCFDTMTAFKTQLDNKEQPDQKSVEQEWEELEKIVYTLCDWEDQIQVGEEARV